MLVGRTAEMERLVDLVDSRRPVALVGAAGIGKTALVRALAIERPAAVGQCLPALTHRPLQPLLHALDLPPGARRPSSFAAEVRAGLGTRLLVVEDAHWADAATLETLAHLVRSGAVVVTSRPGPGGAAVADLVRLADGEVLHLGPLPEDGLDEVVRSAAPSLSGGERRRVVRTAGGNPLVATIVARQLECVGGDRLDALPADDATAALRSVLAELPAASRVALAVLGRRPQSPDCSPVDDTMSPLEGLPLLVETGLVEVRDGIATPVSEVLGELVWGDLDDDERSEVRQRLLDAPGLGPVDRAELLWEGGRGELARELAALTMQGPLSRAEQARALRIAALAALTGCADGGEDPGTSDELVTDAAAALNDCAEFTRAAELLATHLAGGAAPSAPLAIEVLRTAIGVGDRTVREQLVATLRPRIETLAADAPRLVALWQMVTRPDGAPLDIEALADAELASASGAAERSHAAFLHAVAAYRTEPDTALDWLRVARTEANRAGGTTSDFEASRNLVMMQFALGRHAEGRELARACAERAAAEGVAIWALEFGTHERISRLHDRPHDEEAIGWLSWVRTTPVRLETRAMATCALATLLADRGATARSGEVLAPWIDPASLDAYEPMTRAVVVWAAVQRGWLLGEFDEVVRLARWVTEHVPEGFPSLAGTHVVWRWAELEAGRELTAPDPVGGLLPCAGLEADGVTLLAKGEPAAAAECFAEAAAAWAAVLRRCELRCRWAQGLALVRAGSADGVDLLVQLDGELDGAGVPALRPRVRAALREAGEFAAAPSTASVLGLSSRQEQVLTLVAEGLSSPAIARRLGVSVDTVNSHVRAGMTRLGARTRVEAAAIVGLSQR